MKTVELLDKYRKILSGLAKCEPQSVVFKVAHGTGKWETIGEEYKPYPDKEDLERYDWKLGDYQVFSVKECIAEFQLYQLPHCCGIMVSCRALVHAKWRGRRIGTVLNDLRQDIGRALGYCMIICTDIESNQPQRKLLATNQWRDAFSFTNRRTGNRVYLAYKPI